MTGALRTSAPPDPETIINEWKRRLAEKLPAHSGIRPALEFEAGFLSNEFLNRLWPAAGKARSSESVRTPAVNFSLFPMQQVLDELDVLQSECVAASGLSPENLPQSARDLFYQQRKRLTQEARSHQLAHAGIVETLHDSTRIGALPNEKRVPDSNDLYGVIDASAILEGRANRHPPRPAVRVEALAEATKALLASLEYEETLFRIGSIALRTIADWCMVDVIQDDGSFDRVIVLHRDPRKEALTLEMRRDFKPHYDARGVVSRVLRTGKALLIHEVTDEHYRQTARNGRHEEILRALGSHSYMCLPLMARGRFLGAITLVSSNPDSSYDDEDLSFAEELCARGALAVHNSILLCESKRAIQLRDDLIGIVSHDLKNPLAAIQMASQLVTRTLPSLPEHTKGVDRIQRSMESIDSSVRKMKSLISDLLDLSKVGSGSISLEMREHSLESIVGEVVELLGSLACARNIGFRIEIAAEIRLYCDADRISQVLSNLVSNAIKFSPDNGTVRIFTTIEKDKVWIAVQDAGSGIPPEDLPHVFDRFWQAQSTKRAGTGLGLSIVKGFVEAHGGEVRAESQIGKGSCFSFHIPAEPPGLIKNSNGG